MSWIAFAVFVCLYLEPVWLRIKQTCGPQSLPLCFMFALIVDCINMLMLTTGNSAQGTAEALEEVNTSLVIKRALFFFW